MRHGSLFSGIGGFDLAAEWMGWNNVFHCERNEFGQKVLKYYWPNAISYGDITKTDFTIHRGTVDILTGGFPCQPYSMAGKRKGKEDERHLWPEMLRTIREIQPGWVVGENVPGLINWSGGLVFHEVQTDLETAGYEVCPVVLPACGVNAPHRRDRVWFVAYNSRKSIKQKAERGRRECGGERTEMGAINTTNGKFGVTPDTDNERLEGGGWIQESIRPEQRDKITTPDSSNQGLQGCENNRGIRGDRKESHQQPSRRFRTDWSNFPTQPPLRSRDDGLSSELVGITFSKHRNESIKAYGNAIVPQVVFQIFKAIEQCQK